ELAPCSAPRLTIPPQRQSMLLTTCFSSSALPPQKLTSHLSDFQAFSFKLRGCASATPLRWTLDVRPFRSSSSTAEKPFELAETHRADLVRDSGRLFTRYPRCFS